MNVRFKILIVEDEEPILRGLVDVFVYHGYEVATAQDGAQALQQLRGTKYDLILLDVMLPKIDGYTVCNEIRKADREQAIIMLTARSSDEDVINGLSLGADDYISKPFSVRELVLRVQAVLRRSKKFAHALREVAIGPDLMIDTQTLRGRSHKTGEEQLFTRTEVELLQYLSHCSDRAVSRGELLIQVWGYQKGSSIETRTVDIHIAKLRRKIEPDPKHPSILVTVRNEGYRLLPGKEGT